jgi:hypothetical protein
MLKVCIPPFNLSIFSFSRTCWASIFNLSIKTIQHTPKQQRSQMWKLKINFLVLNSGRRLKKTIYVYAVKKTMISSGPAHPKLCPAQSTIVAAMKPSHYINPH